MGAALRRSVFFRNFLLYVWCCYRFIRIFAVFFFYPWCVSDLSETLLRFVRSLFVTSTDSVRLPRGENTFFPSTEFSAFSPHLQSFPVRRIGKIL